MLEEGVGTHGQLKGRRDAWCGQRAIVEHARDGNDEMGMVNMRRAIGVPVWVTRIHRMRLALLML